MPKESHENSMRKEGEFSEEMPCRHSPEQGLKANIFRKGAGEHLLQRREGDSVTAKNPGPSYGSEGPKDHLEYKTTWNLWTIQEGWALFLLTASSPHSDQKYEGPER